MAQFYVDGYQPGDPFTAEPHPATRDRPAGLPDTVDVLVVGSGPAGSVLAAQLAAFPELHTLVVDRRDGPLEVGQADGIACRSMEMLEAFGLAGRVAEEAYRVNEVTFWRPDPERPAHVTRTGRIPDVEEGLSEMPHLIVNQARILAFLREYAARSAARLAPRYGLQLDDLRIEDTGEHPVVATLRDGAGTTSTVRARYAVGCDGARSRVRTAIGRELRGDSANQAWGVMDVLVDTDFPDIRLKSAITSSSGSLLIIPREGGYLVRLYVELDGVPERGTVTPETLTGAVNRILAPYTLDVRDVGWWSVYEVGQRLCDRFDDLPDDRSGRVPRVFIAGDACHTHSAKAGQGMNVSMADGWNLGWKLGAVLRGTARPELLHTYSAERQQVAQELIDFDREFAALFSDHSGGADPSVFQRYFRDHGRYTAGFGVRYGPSTITAAVPQQDRAKGFEVGARFHSAPVVRLADAKPMHLGHVARADGAWRLYLFADRDGAGLRALADRLAVLLPRFTPDGAAPDAVIDVRAVFPQHHHEPVDLPAVVRPRKGALQLVDHEKVFCADLSDDVFDRRGIDRDGAMVLVRPDQYVAHVLALDEDEALEAFLDGALRRR
ncbi:FAD-dependent monooxygenase [Actinomycetospora termitidis]|uniref:FAD-dependent monooxygenase n=1 Tax=Actinomycetospora termitidis TaxID=3053470 RepID=A0ABT7M4M4_9PSEU|nr:FAD-dependent monooxygenase [Actinomycetospora sp. Odt1-22]MDL5155635.1 FAD-dependent monooxygenase [Actinomycetospora sp. Odt1-22]